MLRTSETSTSLLLANGLLSSPRLAWCKCFGDANSLAFVDRLSFSLGSLLSLLSRARTADGNSANQSQLHGIKPERAPKWMRERYAPLAHTLRTPPALTRAAGARVGQQHYRSAPKLMPSGSSGALAMPGSGPGYRAAPRLLGGPVVKKGGGVAAAQAKVLAKWAVLERTRSKIQRELNNKFSSLKDAFDSIDTECACARATTQTLLARVIFP